MVREEAEQSLNIEFKSIEVEYFHKLTNNIIPLEDMAFQFGRTEFEEDYYVNTKTGEKTPMRPQIDIRIIEGVYETPESYKSRLNYIKVLGA